jgi:hypothetical protein
MLLTKEQRSAVRFLLRRIGSEPCLMLGGYAGCGKSTCLAHLAERWPDFASRKELIAQTGHQPAAWPLVVLKELWDNALDACEDARVPPKITVQVAKDGIEVRDNGPRIPADVADGVLDFAVRVSTREAYISPTRGVQGNALKTIVALPFVLDGEQGRVTIDARAVRHAIAMKVDRISKGPSSTTSGTTVL